MKKYILEIYIDEKTGIVYHEKADKLVMEDLRQIVSVLMQIQMGIVMQLNYQSQELKQPNKEQKAD